MKITPFTFESLGEDAVPANAVTQADNDSEDVKESPPPPTFSEDELAAAKQQAYDDGFTAGKKEGIREIDRDAQELQSAILSITENIKEQLHQADDVYNQSINQLKSGLGELVITCADKIASEALRKDPISDIQSMIESCLDGLFDTPKITAIVHKDIKPLLKEKLSNSITLDTDDSIAIGDCRLNWQHGEASRNSEEIWKEIESIVKRHFNKEINEVEINDISNNEQEHLESEKVIEPQAVELEESKQLSEEPHEEILKSETIEENKDSKQNEKEEDLIVEENINTEIENTGEENE